jgi:hypothetical protein
MNQLIAWCTPAHGFIVAYATLWMAWGSLFGAMLAPWRSHGETLRIGPYVSIVPAALLPVGALALTAYYTAWIPADVNEMLSLMTPALLVVFVTRQLRLPRAHRSEPTERRGAH